MLYIVLQIKWKDFIADSEEQQTKLYRDALLGRIRGLSGDKCKLVSKWGYYSASKS